MIAKVRCLAILSLAHLSRPSLRNRYKGLPKCLTYLTSSNLVHVILPSAQHYILNHCLIDRIEYNWYNRHCHTYLKFYFWHIGVCRLTSHSEVQKTLRKLVQVMDLDAFEVDDLVIVRDCLGNALVWNVAVLDRGLDWIQDLLGGPVEYCVLYGNCVDVHITAQTKIGNVRVRVRVL